MTHIGPTYLDLEGTMVGDEDFIDGSKTHDYLRNEDMSWNRSKGLYVKWVDALNQKHRVTIQDDQETKTVIFPVSGKKIDFLIGNDKRLDSTPILPECEWVEVTFSYANKTLFSNHGILVELKGYGQMQTKKEINWMTVKEYFNEGFNIREVAEKLFRL